MPRLLNSMRRLLHAERVYEHEEYSAGKVPQRTGTALRSSLSAWELHCTPASAHGNCTALQRPRALPFRRPLCVPTIVHAEVDYTVVDGKVTLIDQNTGRRLERTRLRSYMHAAIEVRVDGQRTTDLFSRPRRRMIGA